MRPQLVWLFSRKDKQKMFLLVNRGDSGTERKSDKLASRRHFALKLLQQQLKSATYFLREVEHLL